MNIRKKNIFITTSLIGLTQIFGRPSPILICKLIIKMLNIYLYYKNILKIFGKAIPPTYTCSSAPACTVEASTLSLIFLLLISSSSWSIGNGNGTAT